MVARERRGCARRRIAKRLDSVYAPGERALLKVKKQRTADCVVGGFRYERNSSLVGSLLLGLYNSDGKLDHVGFTATLHDLDRKAPDRKPRTIDHAAGL